MSEMSAPSWRLATRRERLRAFWWDLGFSFGVLTALGTVSSVAAALFGDVFGVLVMAVLGIPLLLGALVFAVPVRGQTFGGRMTSQYVVYGVSGAPMGPVGSVIRLALSAVEIMVLYVVFTGDRLFDRVLNVRVVYVPPGGSLPDGPIGWGGGDVTGGPDLAAFER